MKKILILAGILIIIPFATFAHGGTFADADEQTATPEEQQAEKLSHDEMEGLMKSFMVNGKLSEADADLMLTHLNELLSMGMESSGMGNGSMMDSNDSSNQNGHHGGGNASNGMMDGDMMGGGMMWMVALHALVGLTSVVLLIAGGAYLFDRRRHTIVE